MRNASAGNEPVWSTRHGHSAHGRRMNSPRPPSTVTTTLSASAAVIAVMRGVTMSRIGGLRDEPVAGACLLEAVESNAGGGALAGVGVHDHALGVTDDPVGHDALDPEPLGSTLPAPERVDLVLVAGLPHLADADSRCLRAMPFLVAVPLLLAIPLGIGRPPTAAPQPRLQLGDGLQPDQLLRHLSGASVRREVDPAQSADGSAALLQPDLVRVVLPLSEGECSVDARDGLVLRQRLGAPQRVGDGCPAEVAPGPGTVGPAE